MNEHVSALTSEQAQRAILLFYDLLPSELWEDETKLSMARMETLADRLQEGAPSELEAFLDSLRAEGNAEHKGEVAKVLLASFSDQEWLRPYVERAVAGSKEPHMSPIPVDIGTLLTILALLSMQVKLEKTEKGWKIHLAGRAPELVDKMTGFIKALPAWLLGRGVPPA